MRMKVSPSNINVKWIQKKEREFIIDGLYLRLSFGAWTCSNPERSRGEVRPYSQSINNNLLLHLSYKFCPFMHQKVVEKPFHSCPPDLTQHVNGKEKKHESKVKSLRSGIWCMPTFAFFFCFVSSLWHAFVWNSFGIACQMPDEVNQE